MNYTPRPDRPLGRIRTARLVSLPAPHPWRRWASNIAGSLAFVLAILLILALGFAL